MIREFHLSPPGKGLGVSCDAEGAFVGAIPILSRLRKGGKDEWHLRDCEQLSEEISEHFGLPIDMSSKTGGLSVVAKALNEGDVARAQIGTVLLGIPDPPALSKGACSRDQTIKLIRDLHWSKMINWDSHGVLEKAGYNPDELRGEHARWASGGGNIGTRSKPKVSTVPGPAHNRTISGSQDPGQGSNYWQTLGTTLSRDAESLFAEIGRAKTDENNTNLTIGAAEAHAAEEAYNAVERVMEHPLGGSMPITPEFPIWGYGDNATLAPERPVTVGDFVAPASNLLSILPIGEVSRAAEFSELAASDSEAFIIRPLDLPTSFDITRPVGRYVIPTNVAPGTTTYGNLVHVQIGNIVQGSFPNVNMTLRTSPAIRGVDIEIPLLRVPDVGFKFAEIKALTDDGFRSFNTQIARWKLSDSVLAITYDYEGNIYYGFPR